MASAPERVLAGDQEGGKALYLLIAGQVVAFAALINDHFLPVNVQKRLHLDALPNLSVWQWSLVAMALICLFILEGVFQVLVGNFTKPDLQEAPKPHGTGVAINAAGEMRGGDSFSGPAISIGGSGTGGASELQRSDQTTPAGRAPARQDSSPERAVEGHAIPAVDEEVVKDTSQGTTPVASLREGRVIVPRTPGELTALFQGNTDHQAQARVARYIGNWMNISGSISDVTEVIPGMILVVFSGGPLPPFNVVFMYFNEKKWIDRLILLNSGDNIAVTGQIRSIDSRIVRLDNCELLRT